MPTSPASATRARRVREALDQARAGQSVNRDRADQPPPASHGDPPRSRGIQQRRIEQVTRAVKELR